MRIVSCDIHEQAIGFLHWVMGVETILSKTVPEELKLQESFNVVFALSFFFICLTEHLEDGCAPSMVLLSRTDIFYLPLMA